MGIYPCNNFAMKDRKRYLEFINSLNKLAMCVQFYTHTYLPEEELLDQIMFSARIPCQYDEVIFDNLLMRGRAIRLTSY